MTASASRRLRRVHGRAFPSAPNRLTSRSQGEGRGDDGSSASNPSACGEVLHSLRASGETELAYSGSPRGGGVLSTCPGRPRIGLLPMKATSLHENGLDTVEATAARLPPDAREYGSAPDPRRPRSPTIASSRTTAEDHGHRGLRLKVSEQLPARCANLENPPPNWRQGDKLGHRPPPPGTALRGAREDL